jgi:hypothetical protein
MMIELAATTTTPSGYAPVEGWCALVAVSIVRVGDRVLL